MLYSNDLACLIDPSWLEASQFELAGVMSRSLHTTSPAIEHKSWPRKPQCTSEKLIHSKRPADRPRCVDNTSRGSTTLYESQQSSILPDEGVQEVTIDELEDLYREHCLNARLVLQALIRKLRFLREDRYLPFGASTSSSTPTSESAYIQSLKDDEDVLNHISKCYFEVDRRRHAVFEDEFYVGFWDAWCDIRDIGVHRRPYQRYMDSIAIIEKARLDLYFPHRHHSVSALLGSHDTSYFPSYLGTRIASRMSLDQTDLYAEMTRAHIPSISTCNMLTSPRTQVPIQDKIQAPGDLRRLQTLSARQGYARYTWAARMETGYRNGIPSSGSLCVDSVAENSRKTLSPMDFACRGSRSRNLTRTQVKKGDVATSRQSKESLGRSSDSEPFRSVANNKSVNDTCESIIETYSYWPSKADLYVSPYEKVNILQSAEAREAHAEAGSTVNKDDRSMPPSSAKHYSQCGRQSERYNSPLQLLSSNLFDPADCTLPLNIKARGAKNNQDYRPAMRSSSTMLTDPVYLQKSIGSGQHISGVKAGHIRFSLD